MTKKITRIKALIIKELIEIVRDPSSILVAFAMPLMLLFLYGAGVSLDTTHLKIGVVVQNSSDDATGFVESLSYTPYFSTAISRDRAGLYDKLIAGDLKGIVVIPSYFQGKSNGPLQIITDGSEPNTAAFVENYVQGAWTNWQMIQSRQKSVENVSAITISPRVWFNEKLISRNFLVPGSIVIILTLTGTMLTALVVSKEWENGTMEALMTSPVTMGEILMSKFLSNFILGVGTFLLCVLSARYLFDVPLRGSFFWLFISSSIYLCFVLGVGLFISAVSKNQFVAIQASTLVSFLPAFMLSGFLFEIRSMPIYLRILSSLLPPTYFVQNLQTLFLAGNIFGIILPNIAILSAYALFMLWITSRKTEKTLE